MATTSLTDELEATGVRFVPFTEEDAGLVERTVALLGDPARRQVQRTLVHDLGGRQGDRFHDPAGRLGTDLVSQLAQERRGPPGREVALEAGALGGRDLPVEVGAEDLGVGVRQISGYAPDVAALRGGPARIVVGVGETSAGQLAHRTALALAERLGTPPVTFPGDHGGFGSHSAEFAETLHKVLTG